MPRPHRGRGVALPFAQVWEGLGSIVLVQVYAPPRGARSLALTSDGGHLITANPDTAVVHSLRLDPRTGLITGVASTLAGTEAASSIVAWAP